MPIRLAVADGHTLTRHGLRELATQQPDMEVVAECASVADVSRMVTAARPDVLTMDATLPDGEGLALAGELRRRFAALGIVVLASHDRDEVLFQALETGVAAFVLKTAPVAEVLGAIRHAAVAPSSFTASGLAAALLRRHAAQEQLALSPREAEVLRLLQDGLSTPAIAGVMLISHSTVRTYVARLYGKLGATSRAQALMAAMHYGLLRYEQHGRPGGRTPRSLAADGAARPAGLTAATARLAAQVPAARLWAAGRPVP